MKVQIKWPKICGKVQQNSLHRPRSSRIHNHEKTGIWGNFEVRRVRVVAYENGLECLKVGVYDKGVE